MQRNFILLLGALLAIVITSAHGWALPAVSIPHLPAVAVPEFPPWVWIGLVFNFAKNIQNAKKNASLVWGTLTGSKNAQCSLCDKVVTKMLDMTGGGGVTHGAEGLDCDVICPFRLSRCVKLCTKLKVAITSSTSYPCLAIKMCPEMDEFGEVPSCAWSWKKARCTPSYACTRTRTIPLPRCELNDGFRKWRRYSNLLAHHVAAIRLAVKRLPKCGEPDADPRFCVNEATGVGLWAEWFGLFLVFVVATTLSVRAIETKGGDDDRQWLTFWMIYFSFVYFEKFSSILLSRFPLYYQVKLVVLIWLIFFEGAALIYGVLHVAFLWLRRKAQIYFPGKMGEFFLSLEETEDEYIKHLEKDAVMSHLSRLAMVCKQKGVEAVYSDFTSYEEIKKLYGAPMVKALVKKWDELEIRRLEIRLLRAKGLPVMDKSLITGKAASTDAYCIFSLIPPGAGVSSVKEIVAELDHEGLSPTFAVSKSFRRLCASFMPGFIFRAICGDSDLDGRHGGEYGRTRSRTVWKSINPVWEQDLDIPVEGGRITMSGQYINREAAFTKLRPYSKESAAAGL